MICQDAESDVYSLSSKVNRVSDVGQRRLLLCTVRAQIILSKLFYGRAVVDSCVGAVGCVNPVNICLGKLTGIVYDISFNCVTFDSTKVNEYERESFRTDKEYCQRQRPLYTSADAKYMAFRKEYYTRFLAAIERGDTDAMLALDRICDNDSVDYVTETMNWLESWIKF